jgi:hypothetical protein
LAGLLAVGCSAGGDEFATDVTNAPAPQAPGEVESVKSYLPPNAQLLAKAQLGARHTVHFYGLGTDEAFVVEEMDIGDASPIHDQGLFGEPLNEIYRNILGEKVDAAALQRLEQFDSLRPLRELAQVSDVEAEPAGGGEPIRPSQSLELTDKKTEAERQKERDQQARHLAFDFTGCLGHDGKAWDWLDHLSTKPGCNAGGCVRVCGKGEWAVAGAATPLKQTRYAYGMEIVAYNQIKGADYASVVFTYDDPCEHDFAHRILPCSKADGIRGWDIEGGRLVRMYNDRSKKFHRTISVSGPNRLGLGISTYDAKTHFYNQVETAE